MLKKRRCERFPLFQFPSCYVRCVKGTCFEFLYFPFLIMGRILKELLLALVFFALLQRSKLKSKKNIYNFVIKFIVKQYIKSFKLIMTSTYGKIGGLRRRNETMTPTFKKIKNFRQLLL